MLQLIRVYKNAAGDEIRVDTVSLTQKRNNIVNANLMETGASLVYERHVRTVQMYVAADRAVSSIEVIGTFNSIETVSGNYTWAQWDSPSARASMNDLPEVGDTV